MTNKILSLFLGIAFPYLLCGQGETANWYFGNGGGIRFNNDGSVNAVADGRLNTFEGCATISDAFGDLLFYTDGITVYDRNHNVMQNGTGLYGDPSSTQSAIIVPRPQDPNIYYIFTVDTSSFENDPDRGLNYSIVDISLNAGNGSVIQKNVRLLDDCSEKITAVIKNCFEESVWVITLSTPDGAPVTDFFDTYHAFEVNTTGVIGTSVKSTFPDLKIQDPRGNLKLSSDGTKMVSANAFSGLFIYDFDPVTGIVSNQERLTIDANNKNSYGIEFSPSQQFLYVHSFNNNIPISETGHSSSLIQYDLNAPDISGSQIVLETRSIYRGSLQLGQNGKIYRTLAQSYLLGTPYLGVINNPDEPGLAADYQHNAVFLGSNLATQGLPPFVQSFFNKISLIRNSDGTTEATLEVCNGDPFTLEADIVPGATYHWEKDDIPLSNPGNIFQVNSAQDIDSGRYRVEIIPADPTECPIIGESFVSVNPIPEANTLTLLQCDVDVNDPSDGITQLNLEQVFFNDYDFKFYETILDRDNDIPITNPVGYTNTQPFNQTIYYKVTDNLGCENFGILELQVAPTDVIATPPKTYDICDEDLSDNVLSGTFDLDFFRQRHYPAFEAVFYASALDAALEQNSLPDNYNSESTIVYARLERLNQCQGIEQVTLTVNPVPIFDFKDSWLWCTDGPPLELVAPAGFDSYRWLKLDGGSEVEIAATQNTSISMLGDYELEIGYIYDLNGETLRCTNRKSFVVNPSNRAVINEILIEDISDNNTIQIEVAGDGIYEFSIDGETYQDDNFFDDVLPGFITVFVRDKNGCGITEELISVIGYPKFFTPNGDGINDSWQIIGADASFQSDSSISIFDRYGKLLTNLNPQSPGWNGMVDNRALPSADYWFKVVLEDGREFRGHFSLKR
ncbi:T9SS type B sorting domain-containing protein [Spongiimicrobium sp. 3-5]|uniref:T9SS type B sorting domain-containing protein n=1 Tax=Spongiimicrobium sp. 3-5 TaxID=3332596 RepID=UPI0039813A49